MGATTPRLLWFRQGGRWAHWTVPAQQPTVPGPRTVSFQGWCTSGSWGQSQGRGASPVLLLGELGKRVPRGLTFLPSPRTQAAERRGRLGDGDFSLSSFSSELLRMGLVPGFRGQRQFWERGGESDSRKKHLSSEAPRPCPAGGCLCRPPPQRPPPGLALLPRAALRAPGARLPPWPSCWCGIPSQLDAAGRGSGDVPRGAGRVWLVLRDQS